MVRTLVVSTLGKQQGVAPRREGLSGHFGTMRDRDQSAPAPPLQDSRGEVLGEEAIGTFPELKRGAEQELMKHPQRTREPG